MTCPLLATPAGKPRARALGILFDGRPGRFNAITDVPGVEVGYTTLIAGEAGPVETGRGPVRTGVTAILPCGLARPDASVWAGQTVLNGNGELTGSWWIEEAGKSDGPITITNTHSCGVARDATIEWLTRHAHSRSPAGPDWSLPVAGETWDGWLNDIDGFHVKREHVFAAIAGARGGALEEGSVGGGTGMMLYGHKGGSGTASRLVEHGGRRFTVGVFVQANFGRRHQLVIAGIPMADHLPGPDPYASDTGSIIAIVATDAPLISHQLKRLARRVSLGIARTGSVSGHGSGDIFMAFTTAGSQALAGDAPFMALEIVPDPLLDGFFEAVVQASEEAVVNVLAVSEEMAGAWGHTAPALDREALKAALKRYGRYREPDASR